MDLLDALQGSGRQTFKGKYYKRLPDPIDIFTQPTLEEAERSGIEFFYENVDYQSKGYRQSVMNLVNRANADAVIKTRFSGVYPGANGSIEGFVRLQNGTTYTVREIRQDLNSASRQAAFFCPVPVGCEYILDLIRIDDPFAEYVRSETVTAQTVALPKVTLTVNQSLELPVGKEIAIYDGVGTSKVKVGAVTHTEATEPIEYPATIICSSGKLYFYSDVLDLFREPDVSGGVTLYQYTRDTSQTSAIFNVASNGTVYLDYTE